MLSSSAAAIIAVTFHHVSYDGLTSDNTTQHQPLASPLLS